jgi:hypothetical protein
MDLFGFYTQSELTAWVVQQFRIRKGVDVTDISRLDVTVEVLYEDGCCELCWTQEVRLNANYEGNSIVAEGEYFYEADTSIGFNLHKLVK